MPTWSIFQATVISLLFTDPYQIPTFQIHHFYVVYLHAFSQEIS